MALTEKGYNAARLIQQHYPQGRFSAADLSAKANETIVAATLNAVAKNGVLNRFETSPITFELIPEVDIEALAISADRVFSKALKKNVLIIFLISREKLFI